MNKIGRVYSNIKRKVEKTDMMVGWMERNIKIQTPLASKPEPINIREYQKDILFNMNMFPINIFTKCRQLGFTTLAMAYSIHESIHISNYTTFIVVHSYDVADILSNALYKMTSLTNKVYREGSNKSSIAFVNGSLIKIVGPGFCHLKSWNMDHLILDECCYYDFNDIWNMAPVYASKITLQSTPSPVSSENVLFHQLTNDSKLNSRTYAWNENPNWDQDWYDSQIKMLGNHQCDIQLNCKIV